MPNHPMSFNLALIVHRLLTSARGWEVESLKRELAIADRTYRKYRQILTEEFQPFQSRRGGTLVREVDVGPVKYLRMVGLRDSGISDDDFEARLASAYLARQWFRGLDGTPVGRAFSDLLDEFQSTLRDRSFVRSSILASLRERVVVEPVEFGEGVQQHVEVLVVALIRNHPVEITKGNGAKLEGHVELLNLNTDCFSVQLEGQDVVHAADISTVEVNSSS